MKGDPVTATMQDQFMRALTMFREAVSAFPAEEWRKGDTDYLRPAGVAYHQVVTIQP